ncbi:SCO2522 family protein [Parafrankia sp. FMc2]|uniref:SCO2522 family protein n=1 Tax=Parafrankia sp. FMc2 TaxID=3233196 RepID=UPI003B589793
MEPQPSEPQPNEPQLLEPQLLESLPGQPPLAVPAAAPAALSPRAVFRETSAAGRTVEVPLAQLSVELGHFYPEDFHDGAGALAAHFRRIAPWAEHSSLGALAGAGAAGRPTRVSTCLLVDDYSEPDTLPPPGVVLPELIAAAGAHGLVIDYIARESACVENGRVPLARLVEKALIPDPPYGTNGSRPPVHETGWLCNGSRSASTAEVPAMGGRTPWHPPAENAARRHSVFLDAELWTEEPGPEGRLWSCSFLAAVWQLLRLGLLRARGETVVNPVPVDLTDLPARWADFPAIGRMTPRAAPFCAYRTFSALGATYLPVEHAVRVILGQVGIDPAALASTVRRAAEEGLTVPAEPADRLTYLFLSR